MGADLLDLGQHVAREQHRRAGLGDPAHQLAHLAHLAGVEPVGGLVEHQDLGPAEQHACEPQPLPHALRVRLHLAVDGGAEVGDGERLLDVGVGPLVAAGLPPEAQVAHAREVGHERRRLDERADPAQLVGAGLHLLTEEPGLPAGRPDEAEQHAQAGGLAGAVRTEQPADLTVVDGEAQVVDREHARAEALRESDDLDDGFAHRARITARVARAEHCGERSVAPDGTFRESGARGDAQRRRVYLAETPLPSSPLPGLDACARFVDRVVGTLWWHERFPERDLGQVPRLRPGPGRASGLLPGGGRPARPSRSPAATAPRRSCCTS